MNYAVSMLFAVACGGLSAISVIQGEPLISTIFFAVVSVLNLGTAIKGQNRPPE